MQRGPIGPLCMSAAKIIPLLTGGNFASVWIDCPCGGPVVHVRGSELAGTCGLRKAITLAVHRQDVDMVGQPVEERAGEALIWSRVITTRQSERCSGSWGCPDRC